MDMLKGTRIVSFNHFLLGPVGIQYLADLGADVIAVEPLDGAFQRKWSGGGQFLDGQSMLLLAGNRNKRSLAVDLKHPDGLEIARKLCATADVIAENFRPGVMDKMGLGYESVRLSNPRVIYAAASGYGADGPYAERPGQDLLAQALSGLAAITGSVAHGPRAVGVSAADHHGAALLAMGILAALVRRGHSGEGCKVEVNLLSAALDLQAESLTCYLNGPKPREVRQPEHVAGWYYAAPYGLYATRDGWIAISLGSLKALGEALGDAALASTPEDQAMPRREAIAGQVAALMAQKTTGEWEPVLARHGIWHARVNDYDAVRVDPQVRHNRTFATVQGATGAEVTLVTHPVRYDGQAPGVRFPPQLLGAQTAEILSELGYDSDLVGRLEKAGAIRTAASAPLSSHRPG
jgi:crotonobetainyl-CoA:carnitine CoA-transferase CaiB-like acyl-CoA transferase